jgi:hypothetical protein
VDLVKDVTRFGKRCDDLQRLNRASIKRWRGFLIEWRAAERVERVRNFLTQKF